MVIALRELNRFKPTRDGGAPIVKPPTRGLGAGPRPRSRTTSSASSSRRSATSRASPREARAARRRAATPTSRRAHGRARLVRAADRRGVRRLRRQLLRRDAVPRGDRRAAQSPVAAYGVTLIVVGALNKFGSEEQKRDLLGRVAKGGTLAIAMSEPEAGSDVASLKTPRSPRRRRVGARRREDVVLLRAQGEPHPDRLPHRRRRAARGHVDDLRPARRRGLHDHSDPDARRRGDQRAAPRRRARARGGAARHRGRRLDAADGRAQLRAHDPRRDLARHRPARLRRRARLRQGAAASSAARSAPSRRSAQVRRARDRARAGAPARALGRAPDRRGPAADAAAGGLDGEAGGDRARQALRARGHADHGRLRLRDRVSDGAPPAHRRGRRRSTAAPRRSRRTSSPRRSGCSSYGRPWPRFDGSGAIRAL